MTVVDRSFCVNSCSNRGLCIKSDFGFTCLCDDEEDDCEGVVPTSTLSVLDTRQDFWILIITGVIVVVGCFCLMMRLIACRRRHRSKTPELRSHIPLESPALEVPLHFEEPMEEIPLD
ncbi:unnamed protein product [Cylicocyclus nassatus]|uniref:EGF-like domain-containing protein n=1 Tax=Cylicocyclus nassatus TaxID=53992 RepID=A0AA36DW32_CYLNA|nr:unnamed protein product [Cylicocyclus nassatus]